MIQFVYDVNNLIFTAEHTDIQMNECVQKNPGKIHRKTCTQATPIVS